MSKANDLGSLVNGVDGALVQSGVDAANLTTGILPEARLGSFVSFATINMAGQGDFTGGTLYLYKVGRQVTLSWTSLSHSSLDSPLTPVGAIPTQFLPLVTTLGTYFYNNEKGFNVQVITTGVFQLIYKDEIGVVASTSSVAGSITYISAT